MFVVFMCFVFMDSLLQKVLSAITRLDVNHFTQFFRPMKFKWNYYFMKMKRMDSLMVKKNDISRNFLFNSCSFSFVLAWWWVQLMALGFGPFVIDSRFSSSTLNAIIKDVIAFSLALLIVSGVKRMKKMREKH